MKNSLQDLIAIDKELGRSMFDTLNDDSLPPEGEYKTVFALVHDPTIDNPAIANLKMELSNNVCTVRYAIKDTSTLEQIGNYIIEYCKKE